MLSITTKGCYCVYGTPVHSVFQSEAYSHITYQQMRRLRRSLSTDCSAKNALVYFPKDLQYEQNLYTFQLHFSINQLIQQMTYIAICTQTTHNAVTLLSKFDVCVCVCVCYLQMVPADQHML